MWSVWGVDNPQRMLQTHPALGTPKEHMMYCTEHLLFRIYLSLALPTLFCLGKDLWQIKITNVFCVYYGLQKPFVYWYISSRRHFFCGTKQYSRLYSLHLLTQKCSMWTNEYNWSDVRAWCRDTHNGQHGASDRQPEPRPEYKTDWGLPCHGSID